MDPKLQAKAADSWQVMEKTARELDELQAAGADPARLEEVAEKAMDKLLASSDETSFDSAYEVRDAIIAKRIGYRQFLKDTVEALSEEGVHYSEQSVSLKKLKTRFPAGMVADVTRELEAETGQRNDLRFLAMVHTSELSADTSQLTPKQKRAKRAEQQRMEADLSQVLARDDVQGIDIAGPEQKQFTAEGVERFVRLVELVRKAGARRGRPLVVRPHVGEGYAATDPDHVATARANLESLISALEGIGYAGDKDGVVIRFGHATHATPEQLQRMQRLGIIVEANVGSTWRPSRSDGGTTSLLTNLYYEVPTGISRTGTG